MLYLRSREPLAVLLGLTSAQSAGQQSALAVPPPASEAARVACEQATAGLKPMIDLWRDHRPELLWAATARFLDDLAQSARTHGVRVLYAIRDIPLPPRDCLATTARGDLLSVMDREFTRRGIRLIDWSAAIAEIVGGPAEVPRLHGFGIHKGAGHLNYDGHRVWATALIGVLRRELPLGTASQGSASASHPATDETPVGKAAKP